MRNLSFAICLEVMLLTSVAFAGESLAASNPPGPENTEAFRIAYALSSFSLDACGENRLADLYRQVVEETVASCPFSQRAKSDFSKWARQTLSKQKAEFKKFIEEHGKLPDQVVGSNQSCEELKASTDFAKLRQVLDDYEQHNIGANAVIPDQCLVAPVAP